MADPIQQASRHSIYVNRFAGYLANLFNPYSEKLKRELRLIMLDAPETTQSIRRINQIIKEFRSISLSLYGDYNDKDILSELEAFAISEGDFTIDSLRSVIKSSAELTSPAPAQLWAGVNSTPLVMPGQGGVNLLQPYIKEMEAIQIKKVSDLIKVGFMTGRTSQQIARDIAGKDGYLDKQNKRAIKSMVRTATNHVSNVARQKTYDENEDIVIGYEWVSTLDGRTSNICKGLDGTIFLNKDKDKRYPPAHVGCRSTTAPYLNPIYADDDNGTRASAGVSGGKQVDADLSYYDWLKQQGSQGKKGQAFVADVLGKERADLFLNGGLSVAKFKQLTMDDLFRPLPLSELKKKTSLQLAFDEIDG
jgi:SPP1 gp7 family putative phage head morphogenesis protein